MVLILHQGDGVLGDFRRLVLVLLGAQHGLERLGGGNELLLGRFVQAHVGLQTQNPGEGFVHPRLADGAVAIGLQHPADVLVRIVIEQEHIAAGVDGGGHHFLAGHAVGHAHHMGGVGDDHAVEAQLIPEEAGENLGAQGGGEHLIIGDAGLDLPHIFGQHDVAAHYAVQTRVDEGLVHLAIGGHPLLAGEFIYVAGQVGVPEVLAVSGEVLGHAGIAGQLVHTLHIGYAHVDDPLHIVAEAALDDLGVLPVVVDVAHGGEGHVVTHGGGLLIGQEAEIVGVLHLVGGGNF